MLIAVVWILPEEKRLFNMYPEVLYIDVTSDTNKEKRPLFTITGRTALGTMFTLTRAYLPNQTAWMFRWLFSVVFVSSFLQGYVDDFIYFSTDPDVEKEFEKRLK